MTSRLLPLMLFCLLIPGAKTVPGEAPERSESETVDIKGGPFKVAMEPGAPVKKADACAAEELDPNAMSPTWDTQASPVPCGALETDNLAVQQPMGGGVFQLAVGTTAKYGLTPRLEVRWGLPGRIVQAGGRTRYLGGTTDQWLGALYQFHEQGRWLPDLAFDYGFKIPSANPAKGFGSGYADHLLTLIGSRDWGANHLDFNVVGTIVGGRRGRDEAVQLGTAFTRSFTPRLLGTLEAFGGPQPGTSDRYGAVFAGGSFGIHPWLAVNGGYLRSYTAGSPREQYLVGFIYTVRPWLTLPHGSRLGRVLGR